MEVDRNKENAPAVFENFKIRRGHDEKLEVWFFPVVDIIAALIQQPDCQTARNYLKVFKNRQRRKEGYSVCAKNPKTEPITLWLGKVGYERVQDMGDPARSLDRAREYWRQHGRSV